MILNQITGSIQQQCIIRIENLYKNSHIWLLKASHNITGNPDDAQDLVQDSLFKNEHTLDTVFRPSKSNKLVIDGMINTKQMAFMKSKTLVSKFNKKAYLGKCNTCLEMCGLNI